MNILEKFNQEILDELSKNISIPDFRPAKTTLAMRHTASRLYATTKTKCFLHRPKQISGGPDKHKKTYYES